MKYKMVGIKSPNSKGFNNDWQNGVHATTVFLELFFENLLMNAGHELKNRYMHVVFDNESAIQSAKMAL